MSPSQGHILLADDEETFLEATQDLLQEEGYACHAVRNADQLSRALRGAEEFDVLITDLNMPGNRVMELVREIREQATQLPVIVVTGYPSIPTAIESIHLHVLEYLIKPVDYSALLAAIKQGLQQKQVLRAVQRARQEASQRVERLIKFEETLTRWGTSMPASDIEDLLLDDSQKEVVKKPGASSSGKQGDPPAPSSSISSTEYFTLREAVFETIQVLQKTKSAFRSKDLGELRKKLETVLARSKDTLKPASPSD